MLEKSCGKLKGENEERRMNHISLYKNRKFSNNKKVLEVKGYIRLDDRILYSQ